MKHEIKQYVLMSYGWDKTYTDKGWTPILREYKPDDRADQIYVGEQVVSIEVPDDFDPVPKQVAVLLDERRAAMDEYQQKVAEINERLSKLQAIEYTP